MLWQHRAAPPKTKRDPLSCNTDRKPSPAQAQLLVLTLDDPVESMEGVEIAMTKEGRACMRNNIISVFTECQMSMFHQGWEQFPNARDIASLLNGPLDCKSQVEMLVSLPSTSRTVAAMRFSNGEAGLLAALNLAVKEKKPEHTVSLPRCVALPAIFSTSHARLGQPQKLSLLERAKHALFSDVGDEEWHFVGEMTTAQTDGFYVVCPCRHGTSGALDEGFDEDLEAWLPIIDSTIGPFDVL